MQRKLRQGFGRAIRTEADTCVISIALPKMPLISDLKEVKRFVRKKKSAEYFCGKRLYPANAVLRSND
mgnify:CR=1 FL=1